MATEVDYTTGYNLFAPLGKGIGLMGLNVTGVATGEVITTPFIRCVPVASPATSGTLPDTTIKEHCITESGGVITFTVGTGGTLPTAYHVLVMGAMYGTA